MTDTDTDIAVSVFFAIEIDKHKLGSFTSCEGLGCEVVLETREEGGNNAFVWQLPTRIKYSNIKLSRPLGPDTMKVADWISELRGGVTRPPATIQAMTADRTVVARW